ncbi:MAG: OmpH family outer membrane protein [Holosporaceae bacterium]|nr:OmpH family outer membrane protein [Holosporaceae bacterium]
MINFKIFLIFLLLFPWIKIDCASNGVAIVDLKKVALRSKAGKGVEEQIAAINNDAKKDFLDLEANIKSMESNKKSNSDARTIEDAQLMLYDAVRHKKNQIADAYRIAISTLDGEIKKVIAKICQKKGIELVIANDAAVYVGKKFPDITSEVVAGVDLSCPAIKVELKEQK